MALFCGVGYDPKYDEERLRTQLGRQFVWMRDGNWHTLQEISDILHIPTTSVSANLRAFRRALYGAHTVLRRRRGDKSKGLYEYRLIVNPEGL
jgi:hypothetical protein